jgi:nucleotide-binding universal stress UspA family protein
MEPVGFLSLGELTPDPQATRLLPSAVARRYRALPIAVDAGCVTVAMADPADRTARTAVMAALQSAAAMAQPLRVYLVQADPVQIEAWLADPVLVSDESTDAAPGDPPLEVWLWEPLGNDRNAVVAYAEQMAALLAVPLRRFDLPVAGPEAFSGIPHSLRRLLVLPCRDDTLIGPILDAGDAAAALWACQPRWPLRRLLLIVRGDPVDDVALAWATRLARASGAAVTALMVAPHVATTLAAPAHDNIANLLSPHDRTGRRMQQAVQGLAARQQNAMLHLRQGAPDTVIRRELAAAVYDLVITGVAAAGGAAVQWRLRPLLHGLLPDLPCPLLVTRYQ